MQEVILKKLLFWMVLIVGIVALIGSCAKKDDPTTPTTLSAPEEISATGGASQVALDWTAVSGANHYTMYWDNATGVSSSSTAITSIITDNYTHTGLSTMVQLTITRLPPLILPVQARFQVRSMPPPRPLLLAGV